MQILNGKIIKSEIDGEEICFFVQSEADLIQREHAHGKFYETEELSIIKEHFRGGCFVDIGANIGNHTIYVSKYLKPSHVICIEPNPEAIQILAINVKLNELSDTVDLRYLGIGLSDIAGTAKLHQPQINNMGAMQLVLGGDDIRLATGDDLLHPENPTFIKIDVEGMEIAVLRGLEWIISRCSPTIFIEVDNNNRQEFDEWREKHCYSIVTTYRRYAQNENFLIAHHIIEATA
jgi:FkbM family methyltransferase